MYFTTPIIVPAETEDKIKSQIASNRRRFLAGDSQEDSLISVFAVKADGDEENDDDGGMTLMDDWDLVSIDREGFELQLNFTNPLTIS